MKADSRRVLSLLFAIVLSLLPIGVYLAYFFPPNVARLSLISIFLIPVLLITYYTSKELTHRKTKVLVALAFLAIPSLVFMVHNINRIPLFLEGGEPSETRMLAELYNEHGAITFSTSHSYFFQTSFLLYVISNVCNVSIVYASVIIIGLHIILMALVSLYIARIIMKNIAHQRLSWVPYLLTFSLFSSSNMMFTNVGYRYLGSVLLLLLLFFYYDKNCGKKPRRAFFIVTLILTLGITIGDPTAALLMIPLFVFLSILRKNASGLLYAIIPFSYMFYAATTYVFLIKSYAAFALEGFVEFFQEILALRFPERVVPWKRVISPTAGDAYLTSAAYVSLLFLSAIVGLFSAVLWIRRKNERDGSRRNTLMKANCLGLLTMVAIGLVTYVGASVKPEVPFSDIRTIVLIFSSVLLLFSFASKTLLTKLTKNRGVLAIILILLVLSSLRVVYNVYPKSSYDPINVVEDNRLGSNSIYVVASFVNDYYRTGGIIGDYKVLNRIGQSLPYSQYEKRWLNKTTLYKPFAFFPERSILVFNIAGIEYASLYHPKEVYMAAYNFSITHNRLYDNGVVLIASQEKGTS